MATVEQADPLLKEDKDGDGVRRRDFINIAAVSFAGVGAATVVIPLVSQMAPLGQQERLEFLNRKAPTRIAPFLLKHRFVTIAVILNLPGNALIGGGGGIGLVVGMSRLISFHKYFLGMAIAVSPVPICIYLQGL